MLNRIRKIGKLRNAHPVAFAILDIPFYVGALIFGLVLAFSSLPEVQHLRLIWLTPIGGALGCMRYLIAGVFLLLNRVPNLRGRVPPFQATQWMDDLAGMAVIAPAAFYFRSSEAVLLQVVSWMAFLLIGLILVNALLAAMNWVMASYHSKAR
ncbi:hypothetical protein LMG22037_05924 [Paraburkholderia phenoliruptrix]|uniref:Uncharacterized protein n=1 Tax=Paraburkholderia phenoliruptrix TaxID=252970 RepID=A0A6J5CH96_9BURK|nr:hypothetical protein [Paraburkholderia phenoliruptrix]CAB3735033.1 hypothetical protein LMG22037_05924 [Paraburkholderia phenoliruptrix]